MRIIKCDVLDRDGPGYDDIVVAYTFNLERAKRVCKKLNEENANEEIFYKLVDDDYVLKIFKP